MNPFRGKIPRDLQDILDTIKIIFDNGKPEASVTLKQYNRLLDLIPERERSLHANGIRYLNGIIKRKG